MVKYRYFFFLFLINAVINVVNYVPRILIAYRFKGALMSIVISVIIGTLIIFTATKLYSRFPKKGLPEIYHSCMSKPLAGILLLLAGALWYMAGLITLISFVDISIRYISPDISRLWIMIGFLVAVALSSRLSSESVLYGLEITMLLTLPFILYILLKMLINPAFNWDAVMQVGTYFMHKPSFPSITAATFIFSGYANLVIFNRVFHPIKRYRVWLLGVLGLIILLISMLVPIGYLGTIDVERHVFTWFSAADSVRIGLFIVERMIFLFYFIYLVLSLVSVIIHWHVCLELLKGIGSVKKKKEGPQMKDWGYIILFSLVALFMLSLEQFSINLLGMWFLNIRFYGEIIIISSLFYCYQRNRRARI
ncbi:hypothetical protein DCC85_04715 [Paenibacillus sp. CAA11]|uniref:GerAB/ArcD/ProY family transporter n=1 Tax=Paenibacillus sp. CAA11 TaxID=1532905 RepID=UPI000D3BC0BE|nr:GerAB/ArcD/ProY family transporter [Paenibacillus sp. CAA11]AWB43594.1 hypothetical protein DCC85_04715 [Paenibacillus sp. CAA11]